MLAQAEVMKAEAKDFDPVKAIKEIADLFTPIGDGARVVTGEDPITGDKLSWGERGLSLLFIIPLAKVGKYGSKGFKFVYEGIEDANKIHKKADKVKEAEKSTKKASGAKKIESVDDLLSGAKETTSKKGVTRNYEKTGGWNQASKDFDNMELSDVKNIDTKYGPGKVGKMKDGTVVSLRPGSNTGGTTVEIRISSKKIIKIRY
ncbi:pre-toxin TG domain-containing protein [Listeria immobilis]|uniref:Pre-toxin TG domain-containing protein n=1 Tax=Listeria immobilis TaxID=2713502 RepID=A0A7X0X5K5_9LIST|nr:pre-toxin TG domain-containing protein [Listeria immobilis]MBC1488048.1 hypothetical protein [Listeria immobilis]